MASNETAAGDIEFGDVDLHFARLMTRLAGGAHPALAAAAALASRATGNGDVCVRLADYAGHTLPKLDLTAPALEDWTRLLRDSGMVGSPGEFQPLVLDEAGRLYLYRYWDYEKRLAEELLARAHDVDDVDTGLLRSGLDRYFPEPRDAEQKLAAATAVLRRFCVISGGPGTGKTTTVVKILALLAEQVRGDRLAIAVAAPTGKAAARVQDAMRAALDRLDVDLFTRAVMPAEAFTLHRLLGARPGSVRYRHHRGNPLALDVLVVDEASMADLALTAKLVEALPARARLILLGDKDQLSSVEAGSVLGDICRRAPVSTRFAKRLADVTRTRKKIPASSTASPLADSVALLDTSYRFGPDSGIGTLARLVNTGHGPDALALLQSHAHPDIAWQPIGPSGLREHLAGSVSDALSDYFGAVAAGAAPQEVFARFAAFRVLSAHRRGPFGVIALNRLIEDVLDEQGLISTRTAWYPGRAVMITRNDYELRLFNGDVGVALKDAEGHLKVFFPGPAGESVRSLAPTRLPEHETVYAMTIHKSQGSEFGRVLMVLPNILSPVMSRELIYTGVTRAMARLEVWGDETVFVAAIGRGLRRASALQERLWGQDRG
jgi:exodeoxyribonuclease V alpha subunit